MAFDWQTAENAIHSWVSNQTGITTIWANQSGPRPDTPFITLSISSFVQVGQDSITSSFNPSADQGEEITLTVGGNRQISLQIQCFGEDAVGASSPRAIISQLKASLRLPSNNQNLIDAGLFPHGIVSTVDVPAVVATGFEPRTIMDTNFFIWEEITETTGYIDTVSGTGTLVSGTINSSDIEIPYSYTL